jgi:hypothetical protein
VRKIADEEAEMLEAKEQDLCFLKRFVFLASDGWFFLCRSSKVSQDREINAIFFFFSQNCSVPLPKRLMVVIVFFFFFLLKFCL